MAGLMLSRHRSLFLESLPAGCTSGYAFCIHRESSVSPQHALPHAAVLLNTHFHVLRTDCRCSSAAHTPSAYACRALSPELDCSGRSLATRLHEPCLHEHCTNSTPVKLLISRSIKLNNVRSLSDLTRILLNSNSVTLLKTSLFLQCHFLVVYEHHCVNCATA